MYNDEIVTLKPKDAVLCFPLLRGKISLTVLDHDQIKKVKVSAIYDPYVGEMPVREDTCPGPSALYGEVARFFPRRLYLLSVSTRSLFAVGWTVSERPIIGSRWAPNRGLRHSRCYAT